MNEERLKHLEFIQDVITRMNSNSFLLKGWTVTLVAALFALAADGSNLDYVMIAFVPTPIFWLLDSYYLMQERLFRSLYDDVRQGNFSNQFSMNTSNYSKCELNKFHKCMFSITELLFYGSIIVLTLIIMFVVPHF